MKKYIYVAILCCFIFSCNDNEIEKIYSNKIEILQNFENMSIGRRGKGINITFYKDSLFNDYSFIEKTAILSKKEFLFLSDSIQFDLKELNKSYLSNNENGMVEYIQYYLDKMAEYKIRDVNSSFKWQGLTLELDLKKYQVYYIADVKARNSSQCRSLIKSSHKLDNNWYWKEYDVEK